MVPFSLLSATFSLSLPEPSSTQLFSWGVVFWAVCTARIRSLAGFFTSYLFFGLPMFRVSVLINLQGRFHIISSWGWGGGYYSLFSLVILLISAILKAHFSYFSQGFFMRLLPCFSSFWFCSFFAGLHCLLRMHALNSCVGDTLQRLWRDDFTHNGKQVVNRLKIPQGLSTLMFRRWSEVPSRGGVRGDSP